MLNAKWKTLDGQEVPNFGEFLRNLLDTSEGPRIVHIGTDSQQCKKATEYVTDVVVLSPGKGGRVFYMRERVPKIRSLRERLTKEVMMSVTLAFELTSEPDIGHAFPIVGSMHDLQIHVDANPDERYKSSNFVQELAGMVVGQGFKVLLKPESWAATHVADHVVKAKVIGGK